MRCVLPRAGTPLAIYALAVFWKLLDRNLQGNEFVTLPWAYQSVTPGWLPRDWLLNQPLGNQLLAGKLSGLLVSQLGFLGASLAGRALVYALLAAGLARLCRAAAIPGAHAVVALAVFLGVGQQLGAGEWIFGEVESKGFAYACVFFGVAAAIERRWVPASVWLGVATSLHMLVGGYAALAASLLAASERIPLRRVPACAGLYVLCAGVAVYNAGRELLAGGGGSEVARVIVYFRHPHHMDPAAFRPSFPVALLLVAAAGLAVHHLARGREPVRRLLRYAAFAALPLLLGLGAAAVGAASVLELYPFRFADAVVPLAVLLAGHHALDALVGGALQRRLTALLAACVLLAAGLHFAIRLHHFDPAPSHEAPWVAACEWVRRETPPESLLLAPPDKPSVALLCQRASVAQFKYFPFQRAAIGEWYRRMLDLAGGRPPAHAGWRAGQELNAAFFALSGEELAVLMRRYGADYAVTRCGPHPPLRPVHQGDVYCVYASEERRGS